MENERMTQELLAHRNYLQGLHDSAAKILLNMLPKNLPDIEGFNFAVDYKSCDGVGGDMYDVCDIGDNNVFMFLTYPIMAFLRRYFNNNKSFLQI